MKEVACNLASERAWSIYKLDLFLEPFHPLTKNLLLRMVDVRNVSVEISKVSFFSMISSMICVCYQSDDCVVSRWLSL